MTDAPTPIQPMSETELETYRMHRRFDRFGRLVGDEAMKRLLQSHVMVIGLGGVGSFAVESLARSGVGELSLVDFDEICITNFNRQLHALNGLVGEKKAEVLAERVRKIHPQAKAHAVVQFYNERLSDEIFGRKPDLILDCIDSITSKCHLLDQCRKRDIPVISAMGTGGRMDPTQIKVSDLGRTSNDSLARAVRQILRAQYGFPESGDYGIQAVYSTETPRKPFGLQYDGGKGFRCVCPQNDNEFFNCDNRSLIWGNASFVTGAVGLNMAALAVQRILGAMTQ
ncbi:tRNA threonylcarbamoyladenosine dehydratase [Bdellovibrionota bacterium FG-1]